MIKWQVAYFWGMWYKDKRTEDRRQKTEDRGQKTENRRQRTEYMEAAELRTAIQKLTARVEKIRDWL
ncbi:MAG TPA: hypothetical protein HPP66_03635 [Planctomycetes bacterium]|nr:hypothetical protein [Planctomycetota bacterium]